MKRILGSINDVIQLFAAILTTRLEQLTPRWEHPSWSPIEPRDDPDTETRQ